MAVSSSVLDEDMRYVVFVLDDSTGQIVRLVWMRQQMYQGEDVEFSASGTVAVFTQASRHGSFMEVQRLQEIGVKKWAANESLTQRATLTGNCQSGETMRWNDKSNASSTAGINAVNVEGLFIPAHSYCLTDIVAPYQMHELATCQLSLAKATTQEDRYKVQQNPNKWKTTSPQNNAL
ncbi:unnamed protein product [Toxocara canis]|uniref:Ricin B-type lectin domain-containing protein n=1 Tax=Toxocara canis TaxID=6265 RepID=A0A183UIH0_TOXCA|nr:unnamed protein product [Toxocara canis]